MLQEALEQCVSGNPDRVPDCHIAGVEVWYDGRKPAGKRIERVRFDNRQNLEKDRTYTLVVSDFMATGGSGFRMLVSAPREDLDVIDVDALIRYLAVELGPLGIRANAVSGGVVDTGALDHFPNRERMISESLARTPAGRLVEPSDVADAVCFLCSPAAEMVRGQTLVVDGGFSLLA